MDPFILTFLAQSAASAVVGHYVIEGLKRISPALAEMVSGGAKPEEIGEFVGQHDLSSEVEALAKETLTNSYIMPTPNLGGSVFEARAALFADIVNFSFYLSSALRTDLLLPGSVLGLDSYTMVLDTGASPPVVVPVGGVVSLDLGQSEKYVIVPTAAEKARQQGKLFLTELIRFRSESTRKQKFRLGPRFDPGMLAAELRVKRITSRSIKYWNTSRAAFKLTGTTLSDIDTDTEIRRPHEGIARMLEASSTLLSIGTLDEDEKGRILSTYARLEQFRPALS